MKFETEHIIALNGKIFAMLSPLELEVVRYFRDRGRKSGITVTVGKYDQWTNNDESQIRKSNDRIKVETF